MKKLLNLRGCLSTKKDIQDEIIENFDFVKKCKVVESKTQSAYVFIHIKMSIFDYFFRSKELKKQVDKYLNPRMNICLAYEIKPKLFL